MATSIRIDDATMMLDEIDRTHHQNDRRARITSFSLSWRAIAAATKVQ
jgi:hypothetical protein